jgi:CubicO group peptidase (beta-lactamase class C family)
LGGQRALNFTPGTRHEYSHSDYLLLALIVERATGGPFGRHLEREVFEPLGMTASRVYDGGEAEPIDRAFGHIASSGRFLVQFPGPALTGGENVYTSVMDLYRWDKNFDDATVGGRAVVDRMLSRPTLQTGETIPYAFGHPLPQPTIHRGHAVQRRSSAARDAGRAGGGHLFR